MTDEVKLLRDALTDARNNILSLLGGFRDDMPTVAVKLFQAQAKQIDAALATRPTIVTDEVVERVRDAIAAKQRELCDPPFYSEELARAAVAAMPAIVGGE